MKKILLFSVALFATLFSVSKAEAQDRISAPASIDLIFMSEDFDAVKYSSSYGLAMQAPLTDFNLGLSFRMRFNYGFGIIDEAEGLTFDLGPQYTLCFTEHFSLAIPLHISLGLLGTDHTTVWGFNTSPAFQVELGPVLVKAGPTFSAAFKGGGTSFGFIAGLGYCF
uniref:hypothetical protein n=1 Tax=Alistipes sp. TaxID=1872444 RepID=UPI004056B8B4